MNLSDEQRHAIAVEGARVAIRAGAGAGKTAVLALRYLDLIANKSADPDEILAITFTRKAAADMKRRIVGELRKAGLDEQAQRAQVGPISTVDSFCERLLREYPFDAGVDPQFEMLSESAARELRWSCAKHALQTLRQEDDVQRAIQAFGGLPEWESSGKDVSHGLAELIDGVLAELRTAGKTPEELLSFCESTQSVRRSWRAYCSDVLREKLGESYRDEMLDDHQLIGRQKPNWLKNSDEEVEDSAAHITRGVGLLVAETWRTLQGELEARRQMDFSEVAARACQMLEDVPEALAGKYRWVLVDESQDLNPLQHRILRALPAESVVHVGDPQQSIYGFRGAERKHFVEFINNAELAPLRTNFRSTAGLLYGVERVFQNVWQTEYVAMKPHSAGADCADPFEQAIDGIEIWHVGEAPANLVADGVKSLNDEGEPPKSIAILMREVFPIDDIQRRLGQHGIRVSIQGVGKNYFLRNEIRDLASALIALSDPTDSLAVLSLLRSPLVGVSLDGICDIGFRSRDKSAFEALAFFDGSESDNQRVSAFLDWFTPLSARCDTMPAWQVLAEVLAATDSDARFAMLPGKELLIANSRKLLSMALERRHMSASSFGRWLLSQQQLRARMGDATSLSDDADAAIISTIHSAKGLEWDVVVALLNFSKHKTRQLLVVPERSIITMSFEGKDTVSYGAASTQRLARDHEEDRRLLYVALTRAKRKLCIAIPNKEFKRPQVWDDVTTALAPRGAAIPGVRIRQMRSPEAENPPSE